MKRTTLSFILASFALAAFAPTASAQPFYTDPVGASEITIPAGNVPVAPAYVHENVYQGPMNGVSEGAQTTTVTFSNAAFDVNAFAESASFPRYYLEVVSGSAEGLCLDVISNTTSGVTVFGLFSAYGLTGSETVALRKHMTVKDFFEDAESSLIAYGDSVKFFANGQVETYFWTGSFWSADFATSSDDLPIYPGTGFFTAFGSSKTFLVTGCVKTTATLVPVTAGQLNFISSFSPVDEALVDLAFSDSMVPYGDNIKFFTPDGSLQSEATVFWDGSKLTADFATDAGSTTVLANEAFLFTPSSSKSIPVPAAYSN